MEELNLQSILLPGIEDKRPLVISGPCSAETEEQVLTTAKGLAAIGIRIFRAGIWKPRTKPGGFEGVGTIGLPWLKRVKEETGMYVATEGATRDHGSEALKAGVDVLWVGARTAVNPFAMQDVADALSSGYLAAYGADVMCAEPPSEDNPLFGVPNAYLTPHVAWATIEARRRLVNIAVANVRAFVDGVPQNVVNK